jgi:plasmid stabilization system protein ParE
MAEIVWSVKAYEHIEEIAAFIEKDSTFQARRVVQLMIKETRRLKENIRIGKIISEIHDDKFRELRVFSYRIFYKILNENKVAIIGILHGRRLFDTEWVE